MGGTVASGQCLELDSNHTVLQELYIENKETHSQFSEWKQHRKTEQSWAKLSKAEQSWAKLSKADTNSTIQAVLSELKLPQPIYYLPADLCMTRWLFTLSGPMGTFVLITLVINGAITSKTLTIIILMEKWRSPGERATTRGGVVLFHFAAEKKLSAETFKKCGERESASCRQ